MRNEKKPHKAKTNTKPPLEMEVFKKTKISQQKKKNSSKREKPTSLYTLSGFSVYD